MQNHVYIPRSLFANVARFILEQAPHNERAEGLYNGLVVAFASQPAADTPEEAPVEPE